MNNEEVEQMKESRLELLNVLMRRFIRALEKLDGFEVLDFSTPTVDNLLFVLHQMEDYANIKSVDDLLNQILNEKE